MKCIPKLILMMSCFLISLLGFARASFATTCTLGTYVCTGLMHVDGSCAEPMELIGEDDWIPAICGATDMGSYDPAGSRCWDNTATRAQMISGCNNTAAGCADLGGCFGPNPLGHWVVTVIEGKKIRCRCGCWTEDSMFASASGVVSGSDIINAGESHDELFKLTSFDTLNGLISIDLPINGVVYGSEKEDIYHFSTHSGLSFKVTAAHPIPIADSQGELRLVKTADQLREGDLVLGSDGSRHTIAAVKRTPFAGRVVNFNVKSSNASQHFVAANGIVMGDNAWQQALAARDARRLTRADILSEFMQEEKKN